jgi:hypothetical protein
MSNAIFLNNPLTINQNTGVYGSIINAGNFDYIITINTQYLTEGNITGLFENASYKQNNIDMNQVDINLSIHNFLNWETDINNQSISIIEPGLSNIGFGTFFLTNQKIGDLLLEIIAHKMFGHAQAHAAIRNDTEFYTHDSEIWDHLSNTLNLNTIKYDVFNQYIAAGRYANNEDSTFNYINFNLKDLTLDFPLYLNGSVILDASLTNDERNNLLQGPNVGGNQIIDGQYNVPILVRFI